MRSYYRRDVQPAVARYAYPVTKFAGIDAEAEESSLPLSWASYAYNVTVRHGVLTNGIGISAAKVDGIPFPDALSVGSRIVRAAVFRRYDHLQDKRDDMIIALMQNRKLHYARFGDEGFSYAYIQFATENVTFLNYFYNGKDCMLIIGEDGLMYIFDGATFLKIDDAPRMTAACVHNERVYGTVSEGTNRVYFSDDLDPTNWSVSLAEGGYISFPDEGGKVTGVMSFKGNLYIFREYAVHRLSAYVEQSDYVLTKVFASNNRVYFDGSAICNNAIVFLAEDGFYKFDGYSCTKILKGIDPLIESKENCRACFFDNKYYVALSLKRDDEVVGDEFLTYNINNGMIIYDFDTDEVSVFRGADIGYFLPVSIGGTNELFIIFGNPYRGFNVGAVDDSGKLFDTPLKKLWRSPYTDFSVINKDKVLKKIYLTVDAPIKLTARLDKKYAYALNGSASSQMIPVNKRAEKAGVEIFTEQDTFKVKGMLLEFDFIRRNLHE